MGRTICEQASHANHARHGKNKVLQTAITWKCFLFTPLWVCKVTGVFAELCILGRLSPLPKRLLKKKLRPRSYWDRLKWDRSRSVLRSHDDLFTLTPYGKTNYSYLGMTKQFVYPLASGEMGYVTCVAPLGSFLGVSWLVTGITKLWLNELRWRSSGAVISKW